MLVAAAVVDGAQQDREEGAVYDHSHLGRVMAPDSTVGAFGQAVGLNGGSCVNVVVRPPACATVEDVQKLDWQFFRA